MAFQTAVRRAFPSALRPAVGARAPVVARQAPAFTAVRRFATPAANADEEAQVEELEAKLKKVYEQVEEVIEKRVTIRKDSNQATKRHQTDLENETKYGITKFAKAYLQIPDNLERAAGSVKDEDIQADAELKKMHANVLRMQKIVNQAMSDLGIKKMETEGATFDPAMHEAMFAMPMPGKEPNTIFHVMEPGYMIHDRCLRAAKVGVVRAA
mmetsp:Transcript_20100/g.30085  ORF Transcript_20100/g.30085 Transcript_20100/m.30085 type:complete len:212 (+) Transcript_20100:79-714(+)|eukprot:CAMPEP_0206472288 /NCGR_PEP_ID=MMETSP0324_2-20121206/32101_1 /ASSEMBLY_ACC=CAM_ASM_000836 /TAXON_ID=2866 /ORGANISM="Crypthecodinium cohnii, Strain Seligo" /LENGTH=211 /DNA_ID=CAMNT_0053946839 /DNA_START=92 /DNA_END=727 /DNA_ORIENTATION=+